MKFVVVIFVLLMLSVMGVSAQEGASGTLEFRANGEDFVRQGFVSKDGWAIGFNHIFVNLSGVRAHQTNPPYDAFSGELTRSTEMVGLAGDLVVDLAEGDENAETLLVGTFEEAPAGYYNALEFTMSPAAEGEMAGYSLIIDGTAARDGEEIAFVIRFEDTYTFSCGAFVGDERKGIVPEGGVGDIELTFHFDHIFGDAETPADDSLNTGAPGFDMLAALAVDGVLETSLSELESVLAEANYQLFVDVMPSLGHVGEGHCHEG